MLNAVFLRGGARPLQAPISPCWSEDRGGVTWAAWHGVGFDDRGLNVSHAGTWYLQASFLGQGPASWKVTHLVRTFQLPYRGTEVPVDEMRGARGVDPSENTGDVVSMKSG